MMRALARSCAPRYYVLMDPSARGRGRTYWFRPPSVGEAMTLLSTTEGTLQGDPISVDVFLRTLRGWLVSEGALRVYDEYRVLIREGLYQHVVAEVMELVGEGAAPPKSGASTKSVKTFKDLVEAPWDVAVRDYAHTFAREPSEVLRSTPWPLFLTAMGWADALEAARDLRMLTVQTLPNLKSDYVREKTVSDLRRRAGGDLAPPDPDAKVDYKANIDANRGPVAKPPTSAEKKKPATPNPEGKSGGET